MNLAIAAPSAEVYTETFIRMQMEQLDCRLRIHGGPVASETIPGGAIAPLRCLRGWMDTAIEVGLHGTRWDGPQRRELRRRLIRERITVVLANYGPTGVALLDTCSALRLPLVVHFHGYDAHRTDALAKHKDAYRRLGERAAAVIAVSEVMAHRLESYGFPSGKIHLIRYGCDPSRFAERTAVPEAPVFFGVGRFVDKKAPYLTVLAFRQVHEQLPDARLVLGGTGELLEATRNLAQGLGIASAVEFPGVLTPEEVASYMRKATAFVQHSIVPLVGPAAGDSEGTPVAVLEAMLSGLPVISTRHAGIGEVIEDGRTGFLVDERDVNGMSRAMLAVAKDTALSRTLGLQARQTALERFTAAQYLSAIERLLVGVSRA